MYETMQMTWPVRNKAIPSREPSEHEHDIHSGIKHHKTNTMLRFISVIALLRLERLGNSTAEHAVKTNVCTSTTLCLHY